LVLILACQDDLEMLAKKLVIQYVGFEFKLMNQPLENDPYAALMTKHPNYNKARPFGPAWFAGSP
jgi:hypothetical protein